MLLFKSCTIEVKKMLRPRCVENVRLDGKPVDGQTVYNALTYFTFYIIILLIAGLIVSLDGLDSRRISPPHSRACPTSGRGSPLSDRPEALPSSRR